MTEPIRRVEVKPRGIEVVLEGGGRRRLAFGVLDASDIATVHVADGRESIVIRLRSGEDLEWTVDQMTEVRNG